MEQFDLDNLKIKKKAMHEQVYEQMKDAIVKERWSVGERLPSEPTLAAAFGVNRLTVRMALQKLNALGIVETRIGDGTYVKAFDFSGFFREVSQFYMRPELLEDVCDFRKLIEIECVRLAIERATPGELEELDACCRAYEAQCKTVEQNYNMTTLSELAEKDLEFHYKICQLSHNELYAYAFSVARESIYQYLLIILKQRVEGWKRRSESAVVNDGRHRRIYECIVDKDFETCRKVYTEVVDHNVEL